MNERSDLISKLLSSVVTRTAYIKAKLGILVPSQIRALRVNSGMLRQSDLAKAAGLHQSRISMFETPGAANMTIETLSRLAAAFEVGLVVKFVSMSEMLRWEEEFSQDFFQVPKLGEDHDFLHPTYESERQFEYPDLQRVPIRSAGIENRVPSSFNVLGCIAGPKQNSAGAA